MSNLSNLSNLYSWHYGYLLILLYNENKHEIIKFLIENDNLNDNLNAHQDQYEFLLCYSSYGDNNELVKFLINKNVCTYHTYMSLLNTSIIRDQLEIFTLLIEKYGINIINDNNGDDFRRLLYNAKKYNRIEFIKILNKI